LINISNNTLANEHSIHRIAHPWRPRHKKSAKNNEQGDRYLTLLVVDHFVVHRGVFQHPASMRAHPTIHPQTAAGYDQYRRYVTRYDYESEVDEGHIIVGVLWSTLSREVLILDLREQTWNGRQESYDKRPCPRREEHVQDSSFCENLSHGAAYGYVFVNSSVHQGVDGCDEEEWHEESVHVAHEPAYLEHPVTYHGGY